MWGLGEVYELQSSAPPISESESSLWPTASSCIANDGETPETWEARKQRNIEKHYNGNGMGTPLTIAATCWPTPQEHDRHAGYRTPEMVIAARIESGAGVSNLNDTAEYWATPHTNCTTGPGTQGRLGGENLQTMVEHWPTVTARDWRSESGQAATAAHYNRPAGPSLPAFILNEWDSRRDQATPDGRESSENVQTSRRLSPRFVEWLMGFPISWTEL
jgi:hypothetical protein